MLAKIGQYNLTPNIISDTYSVNSIDVYEGWTDGNKVNHRDVIRQRIVGGFEMSFRTPSEYSSFINAYNEAKNEDGSVQMQVYDNSTMKYQISDFYVSMPGTMFKNVDGVKRYSNMYVSLEEK